MPPVTAAPGTELSGVRGSVEDTSQNGGLTIRLDSLTSGETVTQQITPVDEALKCLEALPDESSTCEGAVEYRTPLSTSGRPFPRCEHHWELRLDLEDGLRLRYPSRPPADWSPEDAGESWDTEDY